MPKARFVPSFVLKKVRVAHVLLLFLFSFSSKLFSHQSDRYTVENHVPATAAEMWITRSESRLLLIPQPMSAAAGRSCGQCPGAQVLCSAAGSLLGEPLWQRTRRLCRHSPAGFRMVSKRFDYFLTTNTVPNGYYIYFGRFLWFVSQVYVNTFC